MKAETPGDPGVWPDGIWSLMMATITEKRTGDDQMEVQIKKGSRTEVVEMTTGNVIQYENLTFQNSYWAIVTGINTNYQDEVVGMNVLVIDPDTLKPMIWSTGDFRFDMAFVQNNIFEHFETVADYLDWKADE